MRMYYITFRSITLAQRGERALRKGGIHCSLQRTPRWMEERGCGYCLRIRAGDTAVCLDLLKESTVLFSKVYAQKEDGSVEEVPV